MRPTSTTACSWRRSATSRASLKGAGQVNPGLIFFSDYFGNYDTAEIKKFDIRYIVVDRQLLAGPPAFGNYFDPGTPSPGDRSTA
jgi:hypothetical protein